MIVFKYAEKQREFARLDAKLRRIVSVIEAMARWAYLDEIVITDMFRNDPKSVHHYGRGIDIAILETGGVNGTEKIRNAINILFPYGSPGVDTIPPLDHSDVLHLHVQVKDRRSR